MEVILKNILALPLQAAFRIFVLPVLLLAACTRPASIPSIVIATNSTPSITVERVQVDQGAGVFVSGRSNLPNGECLKTELLANKKVVDWWPRDTCIEIDSYQWEMLAALGHNGAPERLDPNAEYEIHAWWPKNPAAVSTRFPFDLNGPKQ